MKKLMVTVTCLLLFACGPSAEQKKIADDLTAEVVETANASRSSIQKLDEAAGRISSEMHYVDSLRMKFRRDSTSIGKNLQRLKSAEDRLLEAKKSLGDKIQNYRLPDLNTTEINEAIATLKKDREELISVGSEIQAALDSTQILADEVHAAVTAIIARRFGILEGR